MLYDHNQRYENVGEKYFENGETNKNIYMYDRYDRWYIYIYNRW